MNVDEQPDLAAQFGVMSIPTLLVFEQGKLVRQAVGARPKAGVLEPVSYTHLDVYKRQLRHHPCGGRNAPHRLPEAGPDPAAQLSQKHNIAPFAPRARPRGRGCFFLSSKLQNCILCKYSFRGEKIKVHKNWKTREKNAWKYFLFWAVCAIMTLVLE